MRRTSGRVVGFGFGFWFSSEGMGGGVEGGGVAIVRTGEWRVNVVEEKRREEEKGVIDSGDESWGL